VTPGVTVIWHDLECGGYAEDLSLWRALAEEHGSPVLDVGAGTGRITLDLARHGHQVVALDLDGELLDELARRAAGLDVETSRADAREFDLGDRVFRLCLVPMQTIQLLGGRSGRERFLRRARRHLAPGGVLAIASAETLEIYEVLPGAVSPLPDICELDGVVYSSQPTAVRADRHGFVLERRRETVSVDGGRLVEDDVIRLDHVSTRQLEREARGAGLALAARTTIPATQDYVGSEVVILRAE
jgi:SAM-dependent methyltransferase